MLLELAIADAYSAELIDCPLEFVVAHNNLDTYGKNGDEGVFPGCYTAITQSNIAIAKMLIPGHPWVKEFLANSLTTTFKQDPRIRYGDELDKLLQQVRDGGELIDKIDPYQNLDDPAVRSMPIGILSTPEEVIKASMTHGAITNNTPDSLYATIAVGLMCHYFIYRLGKKEQLKDFLNIYIVTDWLESGKTPSKNLITTKYAIEAVIKHHSLSQLLQQCVTFSGRSDHISAIAVAAASCSQEYERDLPQCLFDRLENNLYGRDYLTRLEQQLYQNKG
ncbi:ADP-ribosylglycohydrolase family protein [Waterburya agarophytonicola K14]|uniref:ADP-ribosylglycohydrolase family protein n=1 Tax=Waterburya agarophytonicola KI4 TaxID=2874699 RepID=A0A964FH50_9CYAN|nr:ADP-ribosylglycohydrolase family protein [Waterburya agarophytonicola]MCC0177284.1 ADP-ribosylglycohydrolase family protein [Waterburya agarophytonicola KI4]